MRAITLAPLLLFLASACQQAKAPPAPKTAAAAVAGVTKIVFIDKENACDCTRKRIERTWSALQAALGQSTTIPVERIHVDTQSAQAGAYTTLKPLVVPPGVYFVDQRGGVIELLQGELTQEQIAAILKGT